MEHDVHHSRTPGSTTEEEGLAGWGSSEGWRPSVGWSSSEVRDLQSDDLNNMDDHESTNDLNNMADHESTNDLNNMADHYSINDLNNMADHERINKLNNTSWIGFMYVSGSVDVCIMFNKPLTKRSIILYQTRTKITRSTT